MLWWCIAKVRHLTYRQTSYPLTQTTAGKGRSGTLACSLLLLMDNVAPPKLKRSYNLSEWADSRAEELMQEVIVETDGAATASSIGSDSDTPTAKDKEAPRKLVAEKALPDGLTPEGTIKPSGAPTGKEHASKAAASVDKVLELHTSRRMKPSGNRVGVSIPSQRRWLRYWSEFLHDAAPPQLPLYPKSQEKSPKARLYSIKARMRDEGGGAQVAMVRVANALIERAPRSVTGNVKDRGAGDLWVSLARYEDPMVEEIESRVRNEDQIEYEDDQTTRKNSMFASSKWDDKKMVKSFARMGLTHGGRAETSLGAEGPLVTYNLLPLPPSEWVEVGGKTAEEEVVMTDVQINDGILLQSGREVRVKLYMGQVRSVVHMLKSSLSPCS
jgi:phosphatidylinositol-3,4,5-trisphosphate 3-phosphatase and dual-specificity protein phosphatase PTEN